MNHQRGFALFSPAALYIILGMGITILVLGMALKVQTGRLETTKTEFRAFVSTTKAVGEAAQSAADKRAADDKRNKKEADVKNTETIAALRADNQRLRNAERARGSYLPAPAPGSSSPATAEVNRADVDAALGRFVAGVAGLVNEGDEAVTSLNTAKDWAQR